MKVLGMWSIVALAQDGGGKLEGRLTLEDGQPVRYAAVVIPELDEGTLTDAIGDLAFDDLPAGAY